MSPTETLERLSARGFIEGLLYSPDQAVKELDWHLFGRRTPATTGPSPLRGNFRSNDSAGH